MILKYLSCDLLRRQCLPSSVNCVRNASLIENINVIDRDFFKKLLGLTNKELNSLLAKHTKFHILEKEDIQASFDTLHDLNMTDGIDAIKETPGILTTSATTLKNRYSVLTECSFSHVNINILYRYISVMNKPLSLVKVYGHIAPKTSVAAALTQCIHMDEVPTEAMQLEAKACLNDLRQYFIGILLRREVNASEKDLKRMWRSYKRLRHRSIQNILDTINLMRSEMHFSNEKLLKHGYLLHGDPENMRNILAMEKLAGIDIKEALDQHPKIFMSNQKSLVQIEQIFRENDIPDIALFRNLLIFTLGPRTVANRIAHMKQIDEFRVLLNHPRIGRLIYYQNKAIHRLNYLKENKIFCASLNVLSSDLETFEKYAQNGIDATKGREIVVMLSKKLNRKVSEIRKYVCRHPNWCHIPLLSVAIVYEHLTETGYSETDIFNNIHILFYPLNEILKTTQAIEQDEVEFVKDIDWRLLSKSQFLALILYIIEIDFHFAGDGVWSSKYIQGDSSMQEKSEEMQTSV
ncbi:transcription termination factor 5, mitochondrial [Phlebotomus argentipes]|uniref:transcription termination factor 5, mitochondrial n=1 Tax=Phlebotomus argentipes TaxID=94469 RepID=UPI002893066F|nr:transcription termination factor 5, mitochondrial [Phlebotomus argentipes]